MSLNPFGTRKDWQTTKKKYGIPDHVARFDFGGKLEKFDKAWRRLDAGDYEARRDLLEPMLVAVKAYHKAIKALKDDKFQGKTATEKKTNAGKARAHVAGMADGGETVLKLALGALKSLEFIRDEFPAVERRYRTVDPDDRAELEGFYAKEMRNVLGQPVKVASKMRTLDREVLRRLSDYQDLMSDVNAWAQSDNDLTTRQAWKKMGEALDVLRPLAEG